MKKLISILLAFCLLLGLSVVPAVAEDGDASAETTIDYYKWDFSEEALYTDYTGTKNYGGENGYNFKPISISSTASYQVSHSTINGKDALRLKVGGPSSSTFIVPLKSDGTPFELKPGKTYSINLTARFKSTGTGDKTASRHGIAPYSLADGTIAQISSPVAMTESTASTTATTWGSLYKLAQLFQGRSNVVGGTDMGVIYNNKGVAGTTAYNFFINEAGKEYTYNKTVKMATAYAMTAANVTINSDGSYTFGGKNFNGFFAIILPASYDEYYKANDPESFKQIRVDGETYSQIYTDYYITELEIIETACAVIELHNGDEIIDVLTGDEEAALSIPDPEVPEGKSFAGWFTDKELTTPFEGDTFPGGVTKLYASFEDLETVTVTFINGDSSEKRIGVPGTEIDLPETGIIDTNWYTDYVNNKVFDGVYPDADTEVYSAKYFDTADSTNFFSYDMFDFVNEDDAPALLFDGTLGYYRLGTIEDQVTYKLSFAYKADSIEKGFNINFRTADVKNRENLRMFVEGGTFSDAVYKITEGTDGEWKNIDVFFTANQNGYVEQKVDGGDYTFNSSDANKTSNGLFLAIGEIAKSDEKLYMKDFKLTAMDDDVFTSNIGASYVKDGAGELPAGQAIRYYFDYKTNDGTKIILGDIEYDVVERGVIFRNGDTYQQSNQTFKNREPNSTITFKGNEKLVVSSVSGVALTDCWAYDADSQKMTFSTYVHGFLENDDRELMARGYITFKDGEGNQFTIYSTHVNRSINYLKGIDGYN